MLGGLATFPDVCKLSFSLRIRCGTRRAERKCNPQLQNSFWNSDLEARVGVEPTLRVFRSPRPGTASRLAKLFVTAHLLVSNMPQKTTHCPTIR